MLIGALWAAAARDRELLRPGIEQAEIDAILIETTPSIGFYVVATIFAIVVPYVAAVGYLLIAVFVVLRADGDQPEATARQT